MTKCDLGRAGGPGPLHRRLGQAPLSQPVDQLLQHEARGSGRRPWKGGGRTISSPAHSFQPCHARMGVLGLGGVGGLAAIPPVQL